MDAKQAQELFGTFTFDLFAEEDADDIKGEEDYDTVVKKFTDHFVPKKNIIHERFVFQERKQEEETVEEYLRTLQTLVKTCRYKDSNEQVRDRFVIGLKDQTVKHKLQLESDLTLERAVAIAHQHEQLLQQRQQQEHGAGVHEVHSYRGRGRGRGKGRGTGAGGHSQGRGQNQGQSSTHEGTKQQLQQSTSNKCTRCNGYHGNRRCPASGQICHNCKKRGHFAIVCKFRRSDEVQQSETNQEHREPIPLLNLPLGTTVVDADGNAYWLCCRVHFAT